MSEIYCLILLFFSLLSRSRFIVRGDSMLPTFSDSDQFIVNRFRYLFSNPKRGDIVCFNANWGEHKIYLKRIIGLPGESIQCTGNDIYIDGVKYYENYTREINLETPKSPSWEGIYLSPMSQEVNQYLREVIREVYENYTREINLETPKNDSFFGLGNSQYFVLGDNRETNFDSRRFGPITKKDLIGSTSQICF